MIECNKIYNQIGNYKYFNIIDNKHTCIRNDIVFKQYCLKAESLNFETLKDKFSEYEIL